jgi:hypothetical protein
MPVNNYMKPHFGDALIYADCPEKQLLARLHV